MKPSYLIVALLMIFPLGAMAQEGRLWHDVTWGAQLQGTAGGGDAAPFWFTANRYGLGPSTPNSGLVRAHLERAASADSLHDWRVGYAVDLAGVGGKDVGRFVVQQAYVDVQWRMLGLSLGQKERPSENKMCDLSLGGLVLGHNARPLPQIRLEMPDFWAVPGTRGLFAFKAHLAYGWYTDNVWQRNFNGQTTYRYTQGSMFHSKSLFLRIGNARRFPLVLTGGLEMASQWGGRGYNQTGFNSTVLIQDIPLGGNVWNAFFPSGGDFNDGFMNATGNHIGSWHLRLDWKARDWSVAAYMEHLFEDHSQMFMQYGFWKDMLVGLEVCLPKNPWLSALVYEYNATMDQTGPIIHDSTPEKPLQLSGLDDYYNHHIYGAWQHAGYVMGNPTLLSPLYNAQFGHPGEIATMHNRVKAHHIGLKGQPAAGWSWRALYTHERSLGTYHQPLPDPQSGNFLLLETGYRHPSGWGVEVAYGHNDGSLLGTSNGAMLTLSYQGRIR